MGLIYSECNVFTFNSVLYPVNLLVMQVPIPALLALYTDMGNLYPQSSLISHVYRRLRTHTHVHPPFGGVGIEVFRLVV